MAEPTRLILIRHGETRLNVENIFRGRTDIPLNDNGLDQARRLGKALREHRLAAVYSSPMDRALATARGVASPHGLEVQVREEFHNISLGIWEGRPKAEIRQEQPELWAQWVHAPEALAVPGGETIPQVRERARQGIVAVLARHPAETVAIVTHRSVLKTILAVILGLEQDYFWKFYLDNCSYSVAEYQRPFGFTLTCLNECCHLPSRTRETF